MKTPRHKSPKRRLAIEPVESRLMLSGDGFQNLNMNNYNLDQIGVDYAVISDADSSSYSMPDLIPTNNSASLGGELPSIPRVYVVDQPQFNFTEAIFRDMAGRVNELGTGMSFAIAGSYGDNRGEIVVTGLDSIFAPPFANASRLKFDWTLPAPDDILSLKILSQDTIPTVSIFSAGLQLSAGDTQTAPSYETGTPTIADRLGSYLSQVGSVEVSVSVDFARPVDSGAWFAIAPTAPANTIPPIRNSDAQIDVGRVIDELINSGGSFVDYGVQDGRDASDAEGVFLTDSDDATPQADGRFNVPVSGDPTKLAGAEPFDEGGMIAVQGIVSQVAAESLTPPAIREVNATDTPAGITGELARVAVMELIEGQQDPTAPDSAADHTYLVAMDDASFTLEQISLAGYQGSSAPLAAVRVIADQAGLVASLVTPASPIQLAAVVSAASDAFAAAVMSAPPSLISTAGESDDEARSEAFSQWEDADAMRPDDERSGYSSYGLVLSALAVERVVASRRKKKLNVAAGPPLPVR